MDLQTYTVHYPKGKLKKYTKGKIGNYPVSLVPGQFTDYYKVNASFNLYIFQLSMFLY